MDNELKAMETVLSALRGLDENAQMRVLNWIRGKLGVSSPYKENNVPEPTKANAHTSENLAEFFARANPKSEAEKALVVATYLQTKQNLKELTGREINQELQHLGHKVGNITVAIDRWKSHKPQLMIQTRKEGTSQQAQKKYKVTHEGILAIEKMLSGVSICE